MTHEEKGLLVKRVPQWFHSYDFGDGISTEGTKSLAALTREWDLLKTPDLTGKSVLDVNTWDGWFALRAEQLGAARVVGLDWYMWAMDQDEHSRYWLKNRAEGTYPKPYHEMPYFKPEALPGKVGFDTARQVTGSRVEAVVGDFASMDLRTLNGPFDVVLYLGTLYHMADPIGSLRRLYEVTAPGGLAIIETHAVMIDGYEEIPLCETYGPLNPLNNDSSNWWGPNALALKNLLLVSGFSNVDIIVGPPQIKDSTVSRGTALRRLIHWALRRFVPTKADNHPRASYYRAFAHAVRKD